MDTQSGSGAGGGVIPDGSLVPRNGDGCFNTQLVPVPVEDTSLPLVPFPAPGDTGATGLRPGLLQADVLTQIISAVILGVAPIAAAGGLEGVVASSGSQKPKEVVHSLPWGVSCGRATGMVSGTSSGDSPMPSGDIAMPQGSIFCKPAMIRF